MTLLTPTQLTTVNFSTPIGDMFACASNEGVCLVEFIERKLLEKEMADLAKRLNASVVEGDHPHLEKLQQQMKEYFAGERKQFDFPLHMPGTPFQQQVWQALLTIPYGTTRSYTEQALYINNPVAVRAVARANGMNRIAVIVPCHRVIGSNGALTGYAGGLERKQWLLDFEKQHR